MHLLPVKARALLHDELHDQRSMPLPTAAVTAKVPFQQRFIYGLVAEPIRDRVRRTTGDDERQDPEREEGQRPVPLQHGFAEPLAPAQGTRDTPADQPDQRSHASAEEPGGPAMPTPPPVAQAYEAGHRAQ